jgi:hypothetical protein
MPVVVKSYPSPIPVLLAFHWAAADHRPDFLGFGIEHTPSFAGKERSWAPRCIGGAGPGDNTIDAPTRNGYWWDASIDANDRGAAAATASFP